MAGRCSGNLGLSGEEFIDPTEVLQVVVEGLQMLLTGE